MTGGEDGVVVSRRFRGSQHTQWLWMADLWLAERLAAAARAATSGVSRSARPGQE